VNIAQSALDTIRRFKSHGIIMGAITNGNARVAKIPQLADLLSFCINAEDVGVSKPDKRMFMEAISAASSVNFLKSNWLHVGDDVCDDMQGAREMGFRTAWVTGYRYPQGRPRESCIDEEILNKYVDVEIKSISDLEKFVLG